MNQKNVRASNIETIQHRTSNIDTSSIQRPASNIQHPTSNIQGAGSRRDEHLPAFLLEVAGGESRLLGKVMRLHILSDLHLEFGQVDIPPTEADVVVMAGDIHLGPNGCRWARKQFPDQPVIYVPGNHEYYHHSLPELVAGTIEEAEMEGAAPCLCCWKMMRWKSAGLRFLGCTIVDGF